MKAELKIENPEDIEATLSITMTIREWKQLSAQLKVGLEQSHYPYPGNTVNRWIGELVYEAHKRFSRTDEKK